MNLDLQGIKDHITEIQNMIKEHEISEREKQELAGMHEEALKEEGPRVFVVARSLSPAHL